MKEYEGKKVAVMTTSDCNAKCKHCYVNFGGSFDGERLFSLTSKLVQGHEIFLNGTEILLHPEYFESLEAVGQDLVMTNGLELHRNPQLMDVLKGHGIKTIAMSYHFGAEHLSPVPTEIIKTVARQVKQNDMRLELMTTINSQNYETIFDIINTAVQMDADEVRMFNYLKTGNAKDMPDNLVLSKEQLIEFLLSVQQARNETDENFLEIRRSATFGKIHEADSKFHCPAGKDLVVITPDETVYPCFFLTSTQFQIGHVQDNIIIVEKNIVNNGDKCLATEIFNFGATLEYENHV